MFQKSQTSFQMLKYVFKKLNILNCFWNWPSFIPLFHHTHINLVNFQFKLRWCHSQCCIAVTWLSFYILLLMTHLRITPVMPCGLEKWPESTFIIWVKLAVMNRSSQSLDLATAVLGIKSLSFDVNHEFIYNEKYNSIWFYSTSFKNNKLILFHSWFCYCSFRLAYIAIQVRLVSNS